MPSVGRGTGTPKDRDESKILFFAFYVNRRFTFIYTKNTKEVKQWDLVRSIEIARVGTRQDAEAVD